MSWPSAVLFGSGVVFSTGLVWFFVQAWIFAIQARTVWLIVLLTITTTVAILSQGYLCAIFVSVPPAFASFPFDATASLVRRQGSKTGAPIGWELRSAEQVTASVARPDSAAAASITAVISGDGGFNNDDDDGHPQLHVSAVGSRQVRPLYPRENGAENWYAGAAAAAAAAAEGMGKVAPDERTAGCSHKRGHALTLSDSPAGRGGMSLGGGQGVFEAPRISSSSKTGTNMAAVGVTAAATEGVGNCVEDVVESGRAQPFLQLDGSARIPPPPTPPQGLLPGQGEREFHEETEVRPEEGVFGEQPGEYVPTGNFPARKQDHHHRQHNRHCHHHHHHHNYLPEHHRYPSQEIRCGWVRTASGQTDATILDSENNGSFDSNNDQGAKFGTVSGKAKAPGTGLLGYNDCAESSADGRFSETACVGCKECAERKDGLERETTEMAGTLLSYLEGRGGTTGPGVDPKGGGGVTRLSDEPVVRVSELPDVCAICLGQYVTGEEVHVLPCLHIFHAQCLDIWIVGHPSCPYCKGDLNVLPPESNPLAEGPGIASFVTRPFMRFREYREERRQQRRQQQQQQQQQPGGQGGRGETGGWDGDEGGVVDFAVSPSVSTAAVSPAVLTTTVAA